MSAINFSALPKGTQARVANLRKATARPVYVKFDGRIWHLRQVPIFPVGSWKYGRVETVLEDAGYKMVIGKGALEAYLEDQRKNS
jgi:hypothetical protein